MHIPDGWLSIPVLVSSWCTTLISLILSFKSVGNENIEKISNIGVVASIIFVAQIFPFPIFFGVSGHLLGSALSVIILGLPSSIIVLFIVLSFQAIFFSDGGILALGANQLNLGVIGVFTAYVVLFAGKKLLKNQSPFAKKIIIALAAFLSVVVSSGFAALELFLSGVAEPGTLFIAILLIHSLIGIGEALLTIFIISYLTKIGFSIYANENEDNPPVEIKKKIDTVKTVVLISFLVIVGILAIIASSTPDGLEYVANQIGLGEGTSLSLGLFDDYSFFGNSGLTASILAGILGVVLISGVTILPIYAIKEFKEKQNLAS